MVTCKHSIRSSHETHCLLVLAQPLPTRSKPDDRRRKNDSCSGDRTEKHVVRNGLRSVGALSSGGYGENTHLIVLHRGPFDGYKGVHRKRLGMFRHATGIWYEDMLKHPQKHRPHLETSQMRPTRSASDSPSPRMPPEQTLIPASLTCDIVSRRSS
jgi:hypothetical protein